MSCSAERDLALAADRVIAVGVSGGATIAAGVPLLRTEVGWALGDGREHGEDSAWDAAEAAALYDLLEREVIPAFYERDANGTPRAWVARMRESMARLTPRFSSNRTAREYTER